MKKAIFNELESLKAYFADSFDSIKILACLCVIMWVGDVFGITHNVTNPISIYGYIQLFKCLKLIQNCNTNSRNGDPKCNITAKIYYILYAIYNIYISLNLYKLIN